MLPPEACTIEIGLNTWLDASCWQYKRNTSHDPHGFLPSLLQHIYPCYPHLYGLVAELTYYTVKVQNFITHIHQKKKTGEVSMFTLMNILIPLSLLIREKLNPLPRPHLTSVLLVLFWKLLYQLLLAFAS